MRPFAVLTVCLAAFLLTACSGGISSGDPRVGQFNGAFTGCLSGPGEASLNIWKEGYAYIDTSLEGYIESGSQPERLTGGGREVRFEYTRNELGESTEYSVDGMLSEDGQLISGTFQVSSKTIPPTQCRFVARRVSWDPQYVATTPGNFSCVSGYSLDTPLNGSTGGALKPSPNGPRPSCFSGSVSAMTLRPIVSGGFSISARTSGGTDSRPLAVWSACDGRELACSSVGIVGVSLTQFKDVVLLAEGDGNTAFDISYDN